MTKQVTKAKQAVAVVEPTPMSLIAELAKDPSFDESKMGVMERLMQMKERHDSEEARKAYRVAMSAFKAECPPIAKKNAVNTREGKLMYKFVPLDQIQDIVDPILDRHGFSYTFDSEIVEGVEMAVCVVDHDAGHTKRARMPVKNMKLPSGTPSTEHGGGVTFAKRYAMIGAFNLKIVGEDHNTEPETPISESQAADLDALIDEVGADRAGFMKWAGVEKLDDIPAHKFNEGCRLLRRKKK